MTTTPDPREDRLRARLASYGSALDEAAVAPPPARSRRHLIAVDGPVGGDRARRRPPWRGPVGRVAAVVVVLAALVGTTWAATRPTEPSTTATTERGWADEDVVRPEDRPSAFAALDGSWPLPAGGSLRYVLDRPADPMTFATFRGVLADAASCLWFRTAYEEPDLTAAVREALAAMPAWPGHTADRPGSADREALAGLVAAAEAGDVDRLRVHLAAECGGSGAGLGLPELGRYWLVPRGEPSSSASTSTPAGGSAVAIDPTELRGWEAIAARLGPEVRVDGAIALPGGAYNVALSGRGLDFSLTIGTVDGPVTLPVTEAVFDRGSRLRDGGLEVYAGPIGDDATLAQVVGPGGSSIALSFPGSPDRVEEALGDVTDLAVDLHAAAWPR